MNPPRIIVVGGGAAGFFAAATCAQARPGLPVTVLEKGPDFLAKVRISGGGRCNVTHACFDPQALAGYYPRGGRALVGLFHRFQPRDTLAWFEARGVRLKVEEDGRVFPATDSSQTVVDCLQRAAREAGVVCRARCGVDGVSPEAGGGFRLALASGETLECERLLLATGGCRQESAGRLASALGHTIEAPVPSLFTFHIEESWLTELAGVSSPLVEAEIPGTGLRERGPLLITHWGLSGPAILRLSAWGARILRDREYRFGLRLNWLPGCSPEELDACLNACREKEGGRRVARCPLAPLPARLWERLAGAAGLPSEIPWASLSRAQQHGLIQQLLRTELRVKGRSLNKEEFVTCGGVPLREVNLKTLESRRRPGLHLAGELLDIDGLTGGFNFQAAWTTGWIAGQSMAAG